MKSLAFDKKYFTHLGRIFTSALLCFSLIISSCFILPPATFFADTQEDYINATKQLEELRKQQKELSSDLSDLTTKLSQSGEKIEQLDKQILEKQSELSDIQSNLNTLSTQKDEQYEAMKLRIKYMYENNNTSTLEMLINSENLADLLVKSEYIQKISDYDRQMLEKYKALIVEETSLKEKMDDDMNQLSALKNDALNEENNLKQLVSQKKSQIDISSSNISEAEQLALKYENQLEQEKIARQRAQELAAKEAARKAREEAQKNKNTSGNLENTSNLPNSQTVNYDSSDLAMLAAIIECEAGNQSYEGMLAVGSVVINRVNSPNFANTISGVINSPYQFTPVTSGRFAIVLARGANSTCVNAAQEVLNGNITIDALYFHVYRGSIDDDGTVIGDHVFY